MNSVDVSLYGILDPEHCNGRDLAELAAIAADSGVTILQYRDKVNETRHQIGAVSEIIEAISHTDILLLVNDRVDIALAAGAAGVHLGQCDMRVEDARAIMGPKAIIGLSIKTLEDANAAPVDILDYAFIGGVHDTTSKVNPIAIGIGGWQERAAILRAMAPKLPLGAIAGFTVENTAKIIEAGADGIAVISAIFKAEDVGAQARAFRQVISTALKKAGRAA